MQYFDMQIVAKFDHEHFMYKINIVGYLLVKLSLNRRHENHIQSRDKGQFLHNPSELSRRKLSGPNFLVREHSRKETLDKINATGY